MCVLAFAAHGVLPRSSVPSRVGRRIAACETTPEAKSGDEDKSDPFPSDASKESKPKFKPIRTVKSTASWSDAYFEPFGRKGPGSRPEWDLRPRSLRTDVEGPVLCDFCKGTGEQICSICSGNEYFGPDGKVTCPACEGKKKVPCSTCFGTLKQIELVSHSFNDCERDGDRGRR